MNAADEAPGYWMYETSGVLRPAVEAYLNHEPLTGQQIAALRAYLRQWIMASAWDRNPHASPKTNANFAEMRAAVDGLTSREAIASWLTRAIDMGIDPL
jgi:hypothetical protein